MIRARAEGGMGRGKSKIGVRRGVKGKLQGICERCWSRGSQLQSRFLN
jgi:hypothetical protein